MRKFLLLLTLLVCSCILVKAQNPRLTAPAEVCRNNFVTMHAFFSDNANINRVEWIITPNGGSPFTITASSPVGVNGLRFIQSGKGQSITIDLNHATAAFYTVAVRIYTSAGNTYYSPTAKRINIFDCEITECKGSFVSSANFKETFGTFGASEGRRCITNPPNPAPKIVEYQCNTSSPLNDNDYNIYWETNGGGRNEWTYSTDHTGDTRGGMLICNSSIDKLKFYRREISGLCPGAVYNFTAWFQNLDGLGVLTNNCRNDYIYTGVTFKIYSTTNLTTPIATFSTHGVSANLENNAANKWVKFGGSIRLDPGQESLVLIIENDFPGGCGNDIAIDDIAFEYCAPKIFSYIDGLKSDKDMICQGAPIRLTSEIDPINYFTNPLYQWQHYNTVTGVWDVIAPAEPGYTGVNTNTLNISAGVLTKVGMERFRMMVYENGNQNASNCYTPSNNVELTILAKPEIKLDADRICKGDKTTLTVTPEFYDIYNFTGPNLIPLGGPNTWKIDAQPTVTSTYYVEAVANYGNGKSCSSYDTTTLIVDTLPIVDLGPDIATCVGTPVTLDAGAHNAAFQIAWTGGITANTQTVTVTPTVSGGTNYNVRVTNGACSKSDNIVVTGMNTPGSNIVTASQTLCAATELSLLATNPPVGQAGTWSIIGDANGATILNPNTYSTKITNLPLGDTITVRWTVTYTAIAGCSSYKEIRIINMNRPQPALAGPVQKVCGTNVLTLAGNTPAADEIGTWTSSIAGVSFSDTHDPNAIMTYTGSLPKTVTVRWDIKDAAGVCPSTPNSVPHQLLATPTLVVDSAGTACASNSTFSVYYKITNSPDIYSITATGANPLPGFVNISNQTLAASPLSVPLPSGTVPGTYTFTMSVAVSGTTGCTVTVPFTLTVVDPAIINSITPAAPAICIGTSTSLTVSGTLPPGAVWKWYRGSCGGTAVGTGVTITVTPTTTTTYYVRAEGSFACGTSPCATVVVTVDTKPSTPNAGPDQTKCDNETFTAAASAPPVGTTGTWTQIAGGTAVIANPNSNTTTVTVPAGTTTTLYWTITKGACMSNPDAVVFTNQSPISNNNIASDQRICLNSSAAIITHSGTALAGGNGSYNFQWQYSTAGAAGPFFNIPSAGTASYNPGAVSVTTWFRRVVTTSTGCTSNSNVIRVEVITGSPAVTSTPPAKTVDCVTGTDYTTEFGTPVFSHPDNLPITVTHTDATTTSGCNVLITRTWTGTDSCGKTIQTSQTITVQDTTKPVFTTPAPAAATVECSAIPAQPDLTATDNCSAVTVTKTQRTETIAGAVCAGNYRIIRTWIATDVCGNRDSVTQVLTITDTTKPVFTTVQPNDTTVNCNAIPAQATLTATDVCSPVGVTVTPSQRIEAIAGACVNNYRIIRIWTATDACGNIDSVKQIITVQDTTRPTFTSVKPNDTTVNCNAIPTQATMTATDNCSPAAVTVTPSQRTEAIAGACANNYRIIRIWTATDACGNVDSVKQIITVQDTTKPTFTSARPNDTTVNCNAIPTQPTMTATDNCSPGAVVVTTAQRTETIAGACANNYRIIRTWIATDACGNRDSLVQIITVQDTTRPTFTSVRPNDTTVNCNAIPTQPTMTATDNCSPGSVVVTTAQRTETIPGACVNNYRIIRTWIATDLCGNRDSLVQTITVQDTTKPTFTSVRPNDTTVNCSAIPTQPTMTATDACSPGSVVVTTAQRTETIAGACANNYRIIRTWIATDACGNRDSLVQTITVQDTTKPTFTSVRPNDTTVNCNAIPTQPTMTATDNCSPGSVVVTTAQRTETIPGACVNNYRIIRTWIATDACGNRDSLVQTITVQDTTKPTFTSARPNDTTVNCNAIPTQPTMTATDACSPASVVVTATQRTETIAGACANNYRIIRTWIATDACGNRDSLVQTITVQDTTKPTFTSARPNDTTVNCNAIPTQPTMTATDNCSPGSVVVTTAQRTETIAGACANNYRIIRTWIATDACGNRDSLVQTITVQDTTRPTFTSVRPNDTTVNCNAIPTQPTMTATDNCSPGSVVVTTAQRTETIPGACVNNYRIIRTWIATDACGNRDSLVQVITVQDTTKPTFTSIRPNDTTVNCNAIPTQPVMTATDNCSPGSVVVTTAQRTETIAGACVNNYRIIRTWIATDACGNRDSLVQTITVQDTTKPTFTSVRPNDTTVNCNAIPTQPTMTATDNCSPGSVGVTATQRTETIAGACVNNYRIIRTWIATDACGNRDSLVQTITVQDTTKPTFTSARPNDTTVNCNAIPTQPTMTATDACSPASVVVTATQRTETIAGACANNYRIIRTWIATDACGNRDSLVQTITVQDTTKPTFTSVRPNDTTVNCNAIPTQPVMTATDNCSPGSVVVTTAQRTETIPGACVNNYRIIRTWIATDACGNRDSVVQRITVQDTTRPTFTSVRPNDTTVNCNAIPTQPTMTATDNCSPGSVVVTTAQRTETIPGACVNNYRIIRTWIATDLCGNRDSLVQVITVQDTTKPVFNLPVPADTTILCDNIPSQPNLTATDNCTPAGSVVVTRHERMIASAGTTCTNYQIIRTWIATDLCGNKDSVVQVLTVTDTIKPVFTNGAPDDTLVNCNSIPAQLDIVVSDNCTPANQIVVTKHSRTETIPGACVNNYRIIRTWIASDLCGNIDSVSQTITVQDTTRPTFTSVRPNDTTVNCNAIPTQPAMTATDNCSPGAVVVTTAERTEAIAGACVNNYRIIRTWIATDACGNRDSVVQRITVQDTTRPTFTSVRPNDTTVNCNAIPTQPTMTATDNCSPGAVVVTTAERTEAIAGACVNNYRIIRTWIATDACGNRDSVVQRITVQDTTKPFFTMARPADTTVNCNSIPAQPTLTASDLCSAPANVTVTATQRIVTIPGACVSNYRIIRTWIATDQCGNKDSVFQTITVQDTTRPTFTSVRPNDTTVNCNAIPAQPTMTATDNCSPGSVVVTTAQRTETIPGACVNNYRIIRTWIATDACGNRDSLVQIITVQDTTKPTFTSVRPNDTTVNCNAIPTQPVMTATDNCSPGSVVVTTAQRTETIPGACVNNYRIIRTWIATDACGNRDSLVQTITVQDTTKPTFTSVRPNDTTVNCNAIPTQPVMTATDNCSPGSVVVTTAQRTETIPGACVNNYRIIRTWIATDACGNRDSVVQRITVQDTTRPTFTSVRPNDTTVNCNAIPTQPTMTATDNCSPGSVVVTTAQRTETIPGACVNNYRIIRTWIATDACGNRDSVVQRITVQDTTKPFFTMARPADTTVNCNSIPAQPTLTASDLCSAPANVTVTATQRIVTIPGACVSNYRIIRTWIATDQCGNKDSVFQTITVQDTTRPTFTSVRPNDTTVNCNAIPAQPTMTATDNCSPGSVVVTPTQRTETIAGACVNNYRIIRTWIATDACGNRDSLVQTITVQDTTKPTFTSVRPNDTTVNCNAIPTQPVMTATDNCSPGSVVVTTAQRTETIPGACVNNYRIIRTWIATDACGNRDSLVQTITVQDTTRPTFTSVRPNDTTVNCNAIPTQPTMTATDNCSPGSVVVTTAQRTETIPGACVNNYRIIRTWIATDACGNRDSVVQRITVQDTTRPTFTSVRPKDTTVNCNAIPTQPTMTATDNCSPGSVVVTTAQRTETIPGACVNNYRIIRTWIATDACGNRDSVVQRITVQDTTRPTFTSVRPNDTTVNCNAIPTQPTMTATDNCSPGSVVVTTAQRTETIPGACVNNYRIIRTWIATDACGNRDSLVQRITVQDTTKPFFTMVRPADTTVNCNSIPAQPTLTASDLCSAPANVTVTATQRIVTIPGACVNNYRIIRTWIATDQCGNKDSVFQTITVQDTTRPTFTSVRPNDTTVNCNAIPTQPTMTATDNCSPGSVVVTTAQRTETIPGACVNNYRIIRTWIATDACGNRDSLVQRITVQDTTKPTFTSVRPNDTTVNCNAIPTQPTMTATDNCSPGSVVVTTAQRTETIPGACVNNYRIIRTWIATDACGNRDSVVQRITVQDTTRPTFTSVRPNDTTVNCNAIPTQPTMTATDNCSPGSVVVTTAQRTETIPGACVNNYRIIRTWIATDACGNRDSVVQRITVQDTTKPFFTMVRPADTTVNCNSIPAQPTLTASDLCSAPANVTVTATQRIVTIPGACVSNYRIIRTWIATDQCGNKDSVFQTITVQDTTRPTFTSVRPNDTTVNCNAIPAQPTMTATDNCSPGSVVVTPTQRIVTIPGACVNNYRIIRTWIATDACGNRDSLVQTITVQDTTKPTFTSVRPNDTTVNCNAIPTQPVMTATDNCSPGSVVVTTAQRTETIPGACVNNYRIIRTWIATDACGNRDSLVQRITVQDTTRPTFTSVRPKDTTVNCNAIPTQPVMTATDNCSPGAVVVTTAQRTETIAGACVNNYRIIRTWIATDACGNRDSVVQRITVQDTTRPTFTSVRPKDTTVNCNAIPTQPTMTATDNCSPGSVVVTTAQRTETIPGACVNNYRIIRTWIATDACGNRDSVVQRITVQDTTRPTFTSVRPNDTTVNCNAIPTQPVMTATDNCSPGSVVVTTAQRTETIPGACVNNYRIIRTWIATDACGNRDSLVQRITVQDTTKPFFTMVRPADTTVNCNSIPAQPTLTASDLCSAPANVTVTATQRIVTIPGACVNNYRIIRTWIATDQCGNKDSVFQTITVQDTTRPTFTSVRPNDTTVNCNAIPAQPVMTATDNCSPGSVVVTTAQRIVTIPGACVSNYRIIRTWIATDACGNRDSLVQTITVQDTTRPTFTSVKPKDTTVNCNAIPAQATMTATDNCSPASVVVTPTQRTETIPGACVSNYRIIRTWIATDACGNRDSVVQVITVQDTTRPVFTTAPPRDTTVNCDAIPAQPAMTATDNCSPAGSIIVTQTQRTEAIAGACASNYRIIRTWIATDACGNRDSVRQIITVRDTTRPVFTTPAPANVSVSCDNLPAPATLTATDNCTPAANVIITYRQTRQDGSCANSYTLTRTWTATDACGNKDSVKQIITVRDTTKPVFVLPIPADTTVGCDAIPAQVDVTATDNCSPAANITIIKNQTIQAIPGRCANNYLIIRTWTAIDQCNNSTTITQTITVVDTTRPVFTMPVPADTTVNCDAVPAQPNLTASDNCSPANRITITKNEQRVAIPGACVNNYRLVRTWTATDECGNARTVQQTLTVQDTTRPTFTTATPANATVECSNIPAQPDLAATDNCSPNSVTVTKSEQRVNIPGACVNNYRLVRTWTAVDACGNTRIVTQTLTVQDVTKPRFSIAIPKDTTVNCDAIPVMAAMTATDNCSPTNMVTITTNEQRVDINGACDNNYRLLRTWTATDECGNYTTALQIVTVQDTTRPVFTTAAPADVTVDCNTIPAQPDLTATDNCSPNNRVTIVKNERQVNASALCPNSYQLIRTWTATDECGNSRTVQQTITVQDTIKPVFTTSVPANVTVDCNAIPAQPDLAATDNCSAPNKVVIVKNQVRQDIPGACANNYLLIRTWTATDECNNSRTVTQTITVQDTTRPVFTVTAPANATVDCDAVPAQPDLTATDNCSPANRVVIVKSETRQNIPGACVNNYQLVRTWTATDECGNSTMVQQTLTVQDTTRPVFNIPTPADVTVECSNIPAQPDMTATDKCSGANVTVTKNQVRQDIPGACVNNYLLIRTWTATDECGNSRTVQQTVTVRDTTRPAFTIAPPADATVDCNNIPAQPDLAASDNCSAPAGIVITKNEMRVDIPGACVNNYKLVRTWTATDECGNSRTVMQTLMVQDTTRPVFTMPTPASVTVDCDMVPAQPDLTASDNCSPSANVVVTKDEQRENISSSACAGSYRLIRTWTATDECGNSTIVKQTITVQDTTRPVFTSAPMRDTLVSCSEVPAWPVVTATDNCSPNGVTISISQVKQFLSATCANNYRLIRKWTAKDECGNTAVMQQIITVQDTTKPAFSVAALRDTTVNCDGIPTTPVITATDNCSMTSKVKVTRSEVRENVPNSCNFRLVRTWTATDECGNFATIRQVITVQDTTRPIIAAAPQNVTVTCQQPIPAAVSLTALDNCDATFPKQALMTVDPYVADACNGYTITRRWNVTDACGNRAEERVQVITVMPCPKPELKPTLPQNCSTNPYFIIETVNPVTNATYTLVGITPSNAVNVPLSQTSNRFNLNGATSASFIVRDGITGCASDTVTYQLSYIQTPMVNLGKDTSICGGDGLVLDAGASNYANTIQWSTGASTQRIKVTTAGTYWVRVSNGICITTDTIKVAMIPMPLTNLPDTTICRGQSVRLNAATEGATYLWSTGATTPAINVSTQEDFWVRVMKNGCISIDTVKVTVNPPPDITLRSDTTICPGQSVVLSVASNASRIQWVTGETGSSIVVNKAGSYWVAVSRDRCVVRDTVQVKMRSALKFELGPDRIMCPDGRFTIDARNPDAANYLWNDGDRNPIKSIDKAGTYILSILDRYCDNVVSDSLKVRIAGAPKVNLGNDTMICRGLTYTIRPRLLEDATHIRWSNGSTGPTLDVTEPGTYTVTAYNDCSSTTDEIVVDFMECESKPDIPNAFSPNGDGRNDVFRPVVRGPMYDYEFRVFNRWGEMIFISKDLHKGWDGKYKGKLVDVGTYVWWMSYKKVANGPVFILKGEVTVIR